MAVPRRGFEAVPVEPQQLGRYILLDPIAQARSGTVHRACLRRSGRPDELLAVKRVAPELSRNPAFAERFVEAMGRAAQLEHPVHCAIEDVEHAADGSLYVAMEWVDGKDLGRISAELQARGQDMPPQLVAYIGTQLADALSAAHALTRAGEPAPLFHGELSPADILIGYDGRVRITGLGTLELAPVPARSSYRAPELVRGAACSPRCDVFSLGACLYEVLAGTPAILPEARTTASGAVRRPDSHITQVIPRPLEQIIGRALAERPDARFQSAAELSHALQRWLGAQPSRADGRALAVFMIALFDASIADEEARLRQWLASVPNVAAARASAAPGAPPAQDAVRHSYARLVRASAKHAPSAAPPPSPASESHAVASAPAPESASEATHAGASRSRARSRTGKRKVAARPETAAAPDWTGAAEHTPARGVLMRKLAAEMVHPGEQADAAAPPATEPARAESARERARELPFPDLADEAWDEISPVQGWITPSEERESAEQPRPARRSAAIPPPRPALASHPAPPVFVPPPPRVPAGLAAAAAGASASQPFAQPNAGRRFLVAALVMAGIAAFVAAGVVLRRGDATVTSTLYVQTRPAGAEVYLRGVRLGTAPLQRAELDSGSAVLELRAAGFQTTKRTIQLERGKAVLLDVDLVRQTATTAVVSDPHAPAADLQAQLAAARDTAQAATFRSDDGEGRRRRARRAVVESAERDTFAPEASSAGVYPQPSFAPAEPAQNAAAQPSSATAASAAANEPAAPLTIVPSAAAAAGSTPRPATVPKPAPAPSRTPATNARPAPAAGVTRAPELIAQSTPRFPARARRMGILHGTVLIEFTVDRAGSVQNASVVKADPPGLFDEVALREIQKWKYRPKLDNGTPVETRQRFTFRFSDE